MDKLDVMFARCCSLAASSEVCEPVAKGMMGVLDHIRALELRIQYLEDCLAQAEAKTKEENRCPLH